MPTPKEQTAIVDAIQKAIVRMIATSPTGHDLILIGGFRYRFIDRSVRTSQDIDYHWAGDLEEKQHELVNLFRKRLLPALRRQFGFEGSANPATGPDTESTAVKIVIVSVWKEGVPYSRVEIPVEVTRILHADRTEIRTVDGAIYPTFSDADMAESKIVAVFNRHKMEHRDLVDIFLFGNRLVAESPARLTKKLKALKITSVAVQERLNDLDRHAAYHAKAIQAVIDMQLDPDAAKSIRSAGGGAVVLKQALATIRGNVRLT